MSVAVSAWSASDKVKEAILRSKKYMPATLAAQLDALISVENLGLMTGTVVIWAGSHFFGVGEVVDVGSSSSERSSSGGRLKAWSRT